MTIKAQFIKTVFLVICGEPSHETFAHDAWAKAKEIEDSQFWEEMHSSSCSEILERICQRPDLLG